MAHILNLPTEIFGDILEPLSTADLSRLSRTCKVLHGHLQPHIYHTIDWTWEDWDPCPPFHLLLRTVVNNTRLARLIKVFRARGGETIPKTLSWTLDEDNMDYCLKHYGPYGARSVWSHRGKCGRISVSPKEATKLHDLVAAIAPVQTAFWILELHGGNIDVIIGLTLCKAQFIEKLDLGFNFIHDAKFIPMCFYKLLSIHRTSPVYPHLASVDISADGPSTPMGVWADVELFRLFMFLPQIESINTILLEPVVFSWPSPIIEPRPHLLTTLILRKTTIHPLSLRMILKCTPILKHLAYDYSRLVACYPHWECTREIYTVNTDHIPDSLINANLLSRALECVQGTLESLTVRVRFDAERDMEIDDPRHSFYTCGLIGRLSRLQAMSKLKSIETSWALLFGWPFGGFDKTRGIVHPKAADALDDPSGFDVNPWVDLLPPCIEHISLTDDMSEFLHYPHDILDPLVLTEMLVAGQQSSYCNLARTDFTFVEKLTYLRKSEWPPPPTEDLHALCKSAGLESEIGFEDRKIEDYRY